jgi:flagellar operon protein
MDAISKSKHLLDITPELLRPAAPQKDESAAQSATPFRDVLGSSLSRQVQFSKHAALRLTDRNLKLTGDQMDKIDTAIDKAREKGIRDSLVLVDDMALIVNIKSRTVITAMNQNNDHVFSNIDGAVIV